MQLDATKNISPLQFTVFRVVLGCYLAWHFAALIPYGAELFSNAGVLPEAKLNFTYIVFPNLIAWFDAPAQIRIFLGAMTAAAVCFALGWKRRICAVILWYGWACLFNRNNLISNPGIPYVGLLLIFCAIIPERKSKDDGWEMPAFVYWGAWLLMALGYTYSGAWKLVSPSWQDGTALWHLLTNPLARPGLVRGAIMWMPWPVLAAMTWIALVGELLFLPLCLHRKGRLVAWAWMLSMHLGILFVVDFADLTLGMVMLHLFTFDPEWLSARKELRPILLFDGSCGLCDRAVRFFSAQDDAGVLRFASLQSALGRDFVRRHCLQQADSMILVEAPGTSDERAYRYSTAVLRTLRAIGGGWAICAAFLIVPMRARDGVYRWLAARRYEWFGATCQLPTGHLQKQLIA